MRPGWPQSQVHQQHGQHTRRYDRATPAGVDPQSEDIDEVADDRVDQPRDDDVALEVPAEEPVFEKEEVTRKWAVVRW